MFRFHQRNKFAAKALLLNTQDFYDFNSDMKLRNTQRRLCYLSIGTATRYGLDGQRIESRWGRDFQHLS